MGSRPRLRLRARIRVRLKVGFMVRVGIWAQPVLPKCFLGDSVRPSYKIRWQCRLGP